MAQNVLVNQGDMATFVNTQCVIYYKYATDNTGTRNVNYGSQYYTLYATNGGFAA